MKILARKTLGGALVVGKLLRKWHLAKFQPPKTTNELFVMFPSLIKIQVCKSLNHIQQGRRYSSDQIEELVQDVWAHIAEKESLLTYDKSRPKSNPIKAFTGWTQTVTHNHIVNVLKKESQERFAKTMDEVVETGDEFAGTIVTHVQSEEPDQLEMCLDAEHVEMGKLKLNSFFAFITEHCSTRMVAIYKKLALIWLEDASDEEMQRDLHCTQAELEQLKYNIKELMTAHMSSKVKV